MTEQLIAALRQHRDHLEREVQEVLELNSQLLAANVELEIQVGQLKMKLEDANWDLSRAYKFVDVPRGRKGEPQ